MKRFFQWIDNLTVSVFEGVLIILAILFLIFAWDIITAILKAWKKYKHKREIKKVHKDYKKWLNRASSGKK